MSNNKLTYLLFLLFALPLSVCAQYKDAGLWADFNLTTELTKKLELSINPEIRMNENITRVSRAFADIGLQRKINKYLYATLTYRGGAASVYPDYELRQRIQLGVGTKQKMGDITIGWQSRWQLAMRSASPELDADFYSTLRNKLQVKYTGFKGIDIASSFETFNNTNQYSGFVLQNWRLIATAEKKINKNNYFTLGYMIQKGLLSSPQEIDYVFLLTYQHEFKLKKKSDKKAADPEKKN